MATTSSSSSLVVSYLMESCGLSETQALSTSTKVSFETTSRADIVLTLLERFGFTKPDITKLVIKMPKILLTGSRPILKQKLYYFKSKDISVPEIIKFLCKKPSILNKGLEEKIIPFFDFIRSLLSSDRDAFKALGKTYFSEGYCRKVTLSHIQILRDEEVPDKNIFNFLTRHASTFMTSTDKFKKCVAEVHGMGINPSKTAFVDWVLVLLSFTRENRETKLDALRKYGWTEEQIQHGIRVNPRFLSVAVKKIMSVMDYLVNQMGYSVSSFKGLDIFYYNLEKRIIVRVSVHRFLISKGLIEGKHKVNTFVGMAPEVFLNKFVIPYEVEAPEVRQIYNQASNTRVMENSQSEKVTFCPERAVESVAAVPSVAKVVDKSQAGKPMKKASCSDLMEPEEELEKEDESKKAKKPRKILKKSMKKVERMQGGAKVKEVRGHVNIDFDEEEKEKLKEEEEIVAVPVVRKVVEGSQVGGLKRKVALDMEKDRKKVKKPKKILKKSKEKVEEVHGDVAKKEEEDKSKEEGENVAAPMVENVLEDSQASVLKRKVASDKVKVSQKAKRPKKVLKKAKKKIEEVQGSAKKEEEDKAKEVEKGSSVPMVEKVLEDIQASVLTRKLASDKEEDSLKSTRPTEKFVYDVETPELMQASNARVMEDSQSEELIFFPERAVESVAAVPNLAKVVDKSQADKPMQKASSSDLVEPEEELEKEDESKKARKPRKILKKSMKKVERMQGGAKVKEVRGHVNIDFDEEEKEKFKEHEEIVAVPEVRKVLEGSQVSGLKRKVALDMEKDRKKVKKPKKVLKKLKKKVEEVQGDAAKKEEEDKSKDEEEIVAVPMVENVLEDSQASVLKRKVASDKVKVSQKAKMPKKVLKKAKKKIEEVQGSAKKEEDDKAKEVEKGSSVPMVEKVLEDIQASVLKRKLASDKEEDSLKSIRPTEKFVYDVVTPDLMQASNARAMEDSQSEEVIFCPERAVESVTAVPNLAKVVDKCQADKPMKKASSSDLVEPEEELEKEDESKKARKPRKILKKSMKKVEGMQGGAKVKEVRGHVNIDFDEEEKEKCKEEEEIVAVPVVRKVLEGSQVSGLKRKVALDMEKDRKKVKKPKKVLKKLKKKVEEVQGDAAKKEEEDKSKDEEEIVAVPMVENVLEDSQVSVLKRKVASDKVKVSQKAKRPKKVLKKAKKKIEEVQGSAKKEEEDKAKEVEKVASVPMVEKVLEDIQASALKRKLASDKEEDSLKSIRPTEKFVYYMETPELMQASNVRVMEDSQSEEVIFCPERAVESVAAVPNLAKVVDKSQADKPMHKASSSDLVEPEEELEKEDESKKARKPRKILKKSMEKVERIQGGAKVKEVRGHVNIDFDEEEKEKFKEEEIVAVPVVRKVLEGSQVSGLKRKVALDIEKDRKKVKKPKKVLKKLKKKVEEVQGDAAKKEEEDKSKDEEEIVAVPMVENVLEDSQASVLKRKVASDKVKVSQKAKRPKKVLKKANKKIEEVQGSAKKEEEDKAKEVEKVASVPMVEKVSEDIQASVLKRKLASDKEEDSLKSIRPTEKFVYDVETPELIQASNTRVMEDSQSEEGTFCPERALESVAAVPNVEKVVD